MYNTIYGYCHFLFIVFYFSFPRYDSNDGYACYNKYIYISGYFSENQNRRKDETKEGKKPISILFYSWN